MFFHRSKAYFPHQLFILDVSFQPMDTSTVIICLRSTSIPVHGTLCITIYMALIVFHSTLNQWMQRTNIVIYQDTSHLGAGAYPSRPPLLSESLLDWDMKVTAKIPSTVSSVSTCPLEECSPVQLNSKCTDLANWWLHITQYWWSSMLGPILWNPKIASAFSASVKRAGAAEQESQKTDSDQWLCMMAGHSSSPVYHIYSMRPVFSKLWIPSELNYDQLVYFICQNSYLKIDYVNQFPSWVKFKARESWKLMFRKDSFQKGN